MKMDLAWTKTVLSVYRYLENVCGAIDKIVLQSGLNSANIWGSFYSTNNVETITNRIIDLSERKVTLINLKVLTEEVLAAIDEQDAQILIEKYVDNLKCREIAVANNISMRSVFRKLEIAENAFTRKLCSKGYNDQRLEKFLENEAWIKNAYKGFCSEQADELNFSKGYIEKVASM